MNYYFSEGSVTVRLTRDVRNKNSVDDCPLRWCITHKRERVYYSTGKSLDLKNWKRFQQAEEADFNFKTKALDLKELKDDLGNYFENVLKPIVKDLTFKHTFSFDALNSRLGKSDVMTLNDAFQVKIDSLIAKDRIGNGTIYKTVKNSLEDFKGNKIPFESVTVKFLNDYEKYLIKKGVRTATISLYMRTLRAVINNDRQPYLKDELYPFGRGRYMIKTSKGANKIALTLKQIHAIENFDCGDTLTEFCRDMWIFSFYGSGINFTDIFRLMYTDIVMGELNFVRYKTRNTKADETFISVPVLEPMKRIIGKYGNKIRDGYIFPLLNDCTNEAERRKKIFNITHEANKRIKAICRELKNEDGTMMIPDFSLVNIYTGRHSYATILNKLGIPESFIGQQLGHSKRTITQGYFGDFDRELRFKYNSLLLNPDNDNKVVFMNVI